MKAESSSRRGVHRVPGTLMVLALTLTSACGQPLAVGRPAAPGTKASATLAEARAALPATRDMPHDYRLVRDTATDVTAGGPVTGGPSTGAAATDTVAAPACDGQVTPAGGVTGVARGYRLVARGPRSGMARTRDDELSVTVYVKADAGLMARLRQAVTADCGTNAGDFTVRTDKAGRALAVLGSDRARRGLAEYVVSFGKIIVIVRDVTSGARHGRDVAAADAEAEKYLDLVCGRLLRRRFAIARSQFAT